MKKAYKYTVRGVVQGVGFRYFTQKSASRIGVYGYVKNCFDGSVEVYAIGSTEQLSSLLDAISRGPSYSRVDEVITVEAPVDDHYRSFKVTY